MHRDQMKFETIHSSNPGSSEEFCEISDQIGTGSVTASLAGFSISGDAFSDVIFGG